MTIIVIVATISSPSAIDGDDDGGESGNSHGDWLTIIDTIKI